MLIVQYTSRWEFRSEDHDIKFGIMCKDVNGIESTAVPLHKVNSHQSDEIGVITCPAPATCKYGPLTDHTHYRNNARKNLTFGQTYKVKNCK